MEPGCGAVRVLERSYLGFIVARPLPQQVVGRTLLGTYDDDGGRRRYLAVCDHDLSMLGVPLTIRTLPYQQQDTAVSACATVAIWSALHGAAKLFGTPAPRPMNITVYANKVQAGGRSLPSRGLTLEQMCEAITSVGLEPEVYTIAETTPLLSIAYAYLSMGLPVILGVDVDGAHAVCVDGCSVLPSSLPIGESTLGDPPLIGRRINELYVHDDGIGPFSRIRTSTVSLIDANGKLQVNYPIAFQSSWPSSVGGSLVMLPTVMVVPSHPKMRIRYTDLEPSLLALHRVMDTFFSTGTNLEWEPRLLFLNKYKAEVRNRCSLTPSEATFLLNSQPRFVWCIALRANNSHLMDLVVDATDLPYATPLRTVLWRDPLFEKRFKAIATGVRPSLEAGLGMTYVERLLA